MRGCWNICISSAVHDEVDRLLRLDVVQRRLSKICSLIDCQNPSFFLVRFQCAWPPSHRAIGILHCRSCRGLLGLGQLHLFPPSVFAPLHIRQTGAAAALDHFPEEIPEIRTLPLAADAREHAPCCAALLHSALGTAWGERKLGVRTRLC